MAAIAADAGVEVPWIRAGQQSALRLAVLLGTVVAVYWSGLVYTYDSLLSGLDSTATLAFVPFVPLGVLALVATRWRGDPDEGATLPQPGADKAVALLLFMAALASALIGPAILQTETLTWRADLLSLAPFTAGMVALLFGVRMVYRLRTPLFVLTLVSPSLYRPLLSGLGNLVDHGTMLGMGAIDRLMPGISTVAAPGGMYASIASPSGPFTVSVTQACAGTGAVTTGFLLVVLVGSLTEGRRRRARLSWAAMTLILCWVGNLVRLAVLLMAGEHFGAATMLGELHSWLGAGLLAAVSTASLLLTRPFGLHFRPALARARSAHTARRIDVPAAVLGVIAVAVMIPTAAAATTHYDFLAGRSGETGGSAVRDLPIQAVPLRPVVWAPTYFGPDATWRRWLVFPRRAGQGGHPVSLDVIRTKDAARFDQYGLAACFGYHGYRLESQGTVPLPGGRTGEQIVYADPEDDMTVTVVSWRQRLHNGWTERVVVQRRGPDRGSDRVDALVLRTARLVLTGRGPQ